MRAARVGRRGEDVRAPAMAAEKPNILVIMTDDVGIWNKGPGQRPLPEPRLGGTYALRLRQ